MSSDTRRFPRVLIIGDEQTMLETLRAALEADELSVDMVRDGLAALDSVREHEYAVILVDLLMPRMDGAAFLRAYSEIRQSRRAVVFVMTEAGDLSPRKLDPALVQACIRKPFDAARLSLMVRDCAALFERGPSARLVDHRRGLRLVENR